jgi:hypothetical protein
MTDNAPAFVPLDKLKVRDETDIARQRLQESIMRSHDLSAPVIQPTLLETAQLLKHVSAKYDPELGEKI